MVMLSFYCFLSLNISATMFQKCGSDDMVKNVITSFVFVGIKLYSVVGVFGIWNNNLIIGFVCNAKVGSVSLVF